MWERLRTELEAVLEFARGVLWDDEALAGLWAELRWAGFWERWGGGGGVGPGATGWGGFWGGVLFQGLGSAAAVGSGASWSAA